MRKSLARPRAIAFTLQSGRCFYCNVRMWLSDSSKFISEHSITVRQAMQLRCTGEHITAHQDGGKCLASNIVAACWVCNQRRHRHRPHNAPSAVLYKQRVRKRMLATRWHEPWVFEKRLHQ